MPTRPREDPDDIDYESLYGIYYDDEGNLIPEYVDDIPELEDESRGDETPASKASTDTEQAGHMGHLSLASPYHPGAPDPRDLKVQVSASPSGEVRKVRQVTSLPPKFEQTPEQIKHLVSEVSRQVTQSVVGQLTKLSPADAQADTSIRQALAVVRKKEPTATFTKPDNIQAILRAAKTGGLRAQAPQAPVPPAPAVCGPPVAPVRPQQGQEVVQRGRLGRWNPDPLGLQADITAQQQQKERGRERRTGSAKGRSGSRPRDDVKRGRQTPSSDEVEPAIDWKQNKIGPATWESAGPRAPKSPARTSRTPSSA